MANNVQPNPSINPIVNKTVLPSLPQTPDDEVGFRMEAYSAMNLAMYHKDMLNAGDDPFLQTIAQQNFNLNQAQTLSWKRNIETKFQLIQQDDSVDDSERDLLRQRILTKTPEPINIPTVAKTQAQDVFSPDYIQKGLGTVMSNLNDGLYLDKNQVLYGNGKQPGLITIFGPDAEKKFPDFMASVDKKFAPAVETFDVAGAKKQIAEFKRLGGMSTKEGRKYAEQFISQQGVTAPVAGASTVNVPSRPEAYPNAVWSEEHKMWTIVKDGKLVGLKETQ